MTSELVFTVGAGHAEPARRISLEEAGFRERQDLQEWVRANPHILGPDALVITFEFAAWQSHFGRESDRLDLLALGTDGRLVVAELKRGDAPDTVEMQAIKYAAYVSRFEPEALAAAHAEYLSKVERRAVPPDEARLRIEQHVGGELDVDLLRQPRIVLLAARFSPQVTAAVVWLGEMGLDISLVEFSAYRGMFDTILTVSQLWPRREVEEFTVGPRRAALRQEEERSQRRREATAVSRIVANAVVDDGARFELKVDALPPDMRDEVESWTSEDASRGVAVWQNDDRAPLQWEGRAWSPTGLAKEIAQRATGRRLPTLWGSKAWASADNGETLFDLAGRASDGAGVDASATQVPAERTTAGGK